MRVLYHLWPSAPCRMVRITLAEKQLEYEAKIERVWERRPDFLALSPVGEVPLLVEPDGTALTDGGVILEYLDECYPAPPLIGEDRVSRAETRRLVSWFGSRFAGEVTDNLAGEKIMKRFLRGGHPNSEAIRIGRVNIGYHLEYVAYLAERRRWLAGDQFGLADIAAAAHLSIIDYIGDVPWDDHPEAKAWYMRIKSRPSFRPLLQDRIPGVAPAEQYANLDF